MAVVLLSPYQAGQASAANIFPDGCGTGRKAGTSLPAVCQDANSQQGNNGSNDPIVKILKAAIEVISYFIGIAAIIGILIASLRMITSSGDASAFATARNGVIYSIIGLAVAALAQILVLFVIDKL
ncbi:MAG TPA: hypothetical protein VFN51_00825 [Candidatus Saccharimonadales bacterium]|nr:hypothetical protein [Candidatus Saccharimonadales bacterium]